MIIKCDYQDGLMGLLFLEHLVKCVFCDYLHSGIRRLREDAFPTVFDASLGAKRKGPGRPRKREALHLRFTYFGFFIKVW